MRGLCRNAVLGLGVADGVYMWRSRGIDSGVFSRSLMLSAKNAVLYGQVDVLNGAHLVVCCLGDTSLQSAWGCAANCAQHRATAFQFVTVRRGEQMRSMVAQMGSIQSPAETDGMLPAGHCCSSEGRGRHRGGEWHPGQLHLLPGAGGHAAGPADIRKCRRLGLCAHR